MKPRIVVTLDTGEAVRRGVPFPTVHTKAAYVAAVERAGGLPILVAPTADDEVADALFALADGLVVTGGDFDIPPEQFGAAPASGTRVDPPKPLRTRFEWRLTEAALARGVPVLGICGGMQLLNVVLGGTLHLHIPDVIEGALQHEQPTSPAEPAHPVVLEPGGMLQRLAGRAEIAVNTTHHQAVAELGRGLVVEGRAPDGVVEAVAATERFAVGVQWHPELLGDDVSEALYGALIHQAKA
ncbi:MAG: gamma-glutamyl-gamma-aminobutyrate hydrolase family protein [Deltaproteobacteria bacterium]